MSAAVGKWSRNGHDLASISLVRDVAILPCKDVDAYPASTSMDVTLEHNEESDDKRQDREPAGRQEVQQAGARAGAPIV